jgi:hypothetical protein
LDPEQVARGLYILEKFNIDERVYTEPAYAARCRIFANYLLYYDVDLIMMQDYHLEQANNIGSHLLNDHNRCIFNDVLDDHVNL